jgi:hypothetical protein
MTSAAKEGHPLDIESLNPAEEISYGGGMSTSVGMFREYGVMMSRQYFNGPN